MIIEIGQQVRWGYGYYSDQIECLKNPKHKVIWWTDGVWCLHENKYVRARTKANSSSGQDTEEVGG